VQRPGGRVVIVNAQKGWRLAGIERDAKAIQREVQAGADCFDIGLFAGPAGEKELLRVLRIGIRGEAAGVGPLFGGEEAICNTVGVRHRSYFL